MHDASSTPRIDQNRPPRKFVAAALVLVALAAPAAGCGKAPAAHDHDPAAEAAAQKSLARAIEITERMLKAYRDASSYTDHATYVEESVIRGEGVPHEIPYYEISTAFRRPNLLRLTFSEAVADAKGVRQGFDVASNGAVIRATMPEIPDQIVEKKAPQALSAATLLADPLIEKKLLERRLGDVFPQLAMLVNTSDDDAAAIFPDDSNPRLLANETLRGHDCYRVATTHPEGTRVFWIDRETYALTRMELPVEAHRQRIDPDRHFLRLSVRIDFDDVTFGAEISPDTFILATPQDARVVESFVLPANSDQASAEAERADGETAKDARDAKEEGEDKSSGDEDRGE